MGKKYIIELEDENYHQYSDSEPSDYLWRVKGFNALVFDKVGISKLTPYTEPDLEQVRKEAYKDGREAGIKDGMCEAWEAATKIANMPYGEEEKVFGSGGWTFIINHTASEAIEKIRQYELEKELEQLQKGVEKPIRAEYIMRQYLDTFCKGRSCSGCPLNTPDFTCGREYHFLTATPVSDEEVRRAYAEVIKR